MPFYLRVELIKDIQALFEPFLLKCLIFLVLFAFMLIQVCKLLKPFPFSDKKHLAASLRVLRVARFDGWEGDHSRSIAFKRVLIVLLKRLEDIFSLLISRMVPDVDVWDLELFCRTLNTNVCHNKSRTHCNSRKLACHTSLISDICINHLIHCVQVSSSRDNIISMNLVALNLNTNSLSVISDDLRHLCACQNASAGRFDDRNLAVSESLSPSSWIAASFERKA